MVRPARAARVAVPLVLAVGLLFPVPAAAEQPAPGIDPYLAARAPEHIEWSPDGTRIAAYLASSRDDEIRIYDVATRAMTRVVSGLPRPRRYKDRPDLRWTADGKGLIYRHGTQYFSISSGGGAPRPLLEDTLPREIVVLSPAGDQVSFVRNGDLWVQSLEEGVPRKLVEGQKFLASQAEFYGRFTQWTPWAPNGRHLVYLAPVPDSGLKLGIVRVSDGSVRWVPTGGSIWDYWSVDWSPDGSRIAVSRLARDFQRKELVVYDLERDQLIPVREDTDPEWVNHNIDPTFGPTWSPDGTALAFISNRSGWRSLAVFDFAGGGVRELTEPGYEVWTAWWSPDGKSVLAATGRGDRHSVRLWTIPVAGGEARLLSPGPGIVENAAARGTSPTVAWSPDGGRVAYGFTSPNDAFTIAVANARSDQTPVVLYSATAEGLPLRHQAAIEAVEFTARDGARIPGILLKPRGLRRGEQRPALVYHYGGWGQQARLGWGLGIKSRLFEYLVSRGYVVFIVDPRGSEGYGRTHSHGLFHEGGGLQANDLADAARYLAASGRARPNAIGLFGHSYGAYLALTTMIRAPGVFRAGVLQAGVFDWAAFGGGGSYVKIRFGQVPKSPAVPDVQLRPATHVDQLQDPVLVYHGTNDFNAPIGFSDQLVRELLKAGRAFDYMVYPNEPHDWDREDTEQDFLDRTERFLSRYLTKPARPPHSSPTAAQ